MHFDTDITTSYEALARIVIPLLLIWNDALDNSVQRLVPAPIETPIR